ncbi:hypothetical protein Fmac_028332 [Flemingia macrophylla]|uniref:S5 DRBM domain-containing protein n=1 Tax=Flemingia macrophylla TaxID=520843 RepID=A0ABD1L770_9FABA
MGRPQHGWDSDTVVYYKINEDEFHKISLLDCDFFIRKASDPDNDVYDFREGFDIRLIDMNRTCKVTKGGQVVKYTAMVACGNYNGVIGFAKAKGPAIPVALQMVYLWLARTTTGMKAGRTVESILHLAGLKNVKSKVIGSKNPHNTVKAVFKALNVISN